MLTENEVGAFLAVRHLVEMEHRSIGFIGEVGRTPSYRERWNGYRTAMNRFGLPISVAWEQTTVSEVESMQSLTTLRDGPSAWFCANDIYAPMLSSIVMMLVCAFLRMWRSWGSMICR